MSKKHDPAKWPDDAHDVWVNKKDFESRIIPDPETQCWEFRGARHRQGYKFIGVIRKSDNRYIMATAHRVSYRIYHGPITQPNINHTCHNCGCVNPAHIYQGTQLQNVHDTIRLGLMPRYRDRYKPRVDRGGNQPPAPSRPAKKSRRKYKYSEEDIQFGRTAKLEDIMIRFNAPTRIRASALRYEFCRLYKWLPWPNDKK